MAIFKRDIEGLALLNALLSGRITKRIACARYSALLRVRGVL